MSGHSRKYKIMLTNEERNHLKAVLRSSKTCNTIKKRCQILLALDCNTNPDTTYRNCAYYLGVSLKMVCNIVKLYCESGLQRTLVLNRNVNSDNATRKIDGAMEARIIAMACGSPPEGYAKWTIKLLTEHAKVELGLTAGEETVRRMLKKHIAPSPERLLVHSKKHTLGSLYKRFRPDEARRLAGRLEIHHTPKHGSWLNMAEIELNVLTRQCLN